MLDKFFDLFKKKEDKEIEEEVLEEVQENEEQTDLTKSEEDNSSENIIVEDKIEEEIVEDDIEDSIKKENKTEEIEEEPLLEETAEEIIKEDIDNKDEELIEDNLTEEEKEVEEKQGFFAKLKNGLLKTRDNISSKIDQVLASYRTVDEELFEDLEETLVSADIGIQPTMEIMDELRDRVKLKKIENPADVKAELASVMKEKLKSKNLDNTFNFDDKPTILLVVGVNGVGKTTTIGKIAHQQKEKGKKVTLVAADTFRAAAIEQLTEWANRANVDIIAHSEGSDPAAVIYDGISSAKSKNTDILICDTAGRLHNKKNLMNELNKIHRVIEREYPEARKEVLLVVDGTTGQNAIFQAKEFKEAAGLTGVAITKLDGTAKGGVVFPLQLELGLPVKLIGVGEQIDNLMEFNSDNFIDAIIN
ncbi:MAG: signal recognition particle-docking protein FtsY [Tissierellia bacterium]|nr:signal recognition particle-docking protein FtsY [Tissierellia bacterium]